MLTRRGFLGLLVGGVAAAALPWQRGTPAVLEDRQVGIAIRFVKEWSITPDVVPRQDLIFGWPALTEPLACRIEG